MLENRESFTEEKILIVILKDESALSRWERAETKVRKLAFVLMIY